MDEAHAWLAAQPGLSAPVIKAATAAGEHQLAVWQEHHDRRVTAARSHLVTTLQHGRLQSARCAAKLRASVTTQHPSLRLAISPVCIGFNRWSQFMCLVSGVMAMLTVSIWFYWNKGSICCADMRSGTSVGSQTEE